MATAAHTFNIDTKKEILRKKTSTYSSRLRMLHAHKINWKYSQDICSNCREFVCNYKRKYRKIEKYCAKITRKSFTLKNFEWHCMNETRTNVMKWILLKAHNKCGTEMLKTTSKSLKKFFFCIIDIRFGRAPKRVCSTLSSTMPIWCLHNGKAMPHFSNSRTVFSLKFIEK